MHPGKFLVFAIVIACTVALSYSPSAADAWPQRNVRIVTPFPAGTGGDIAARLFAERLAERWGRPVIVENRPGADGILAVTALTGAHDEHTLLFTNGGPLTTNSVTHEKLPYDPARDLIPISLGADVSLAVSVPASLNLDSLAGLVGLARAQPGKLNWSATPGALDYVVPGFLKGSELNLVHVYYKQIAPAMQDLAEGRLHLYVSALATQLPMVQAGKVKVLAVTNRERTSLVPDAPTTAEVGFPDLALEGLLGFFGPSDMPGELLDRIAADIRTVGSDPAMGARLSSSGLSVRTSKPAELGAMIERERSIVARFARLVARNP
jgi:tripartite-type tricarboxylate transporter receptor subunit TctC